MGGNERMRSKIQPLVSVIVPCYNYAHFLPDCLKSILGQTFKDFEAIIVDDGSTDNSKEVAKRFLSDPRFHYIYQVNQGLSAARNTGIRNAKGEFIAIVDPDDMWFPTKLEEQIKFMEKHPSYGLVYSDAELYIGGKHSSRTVRNGKLFYDGWCFEEMLMDNGVVCPSVLIRKECFDTVGLFDDEVLAMYSEDWDQWLRIARKYKIGSIQKPLLYYRVHERSMSKTDFQRHFKNIIITLERHLPYLKRDEEQKLVLEHHLWRFAGAALREGDKSLLIRILLRLFIISPVRTMRWLASKTLNRLRSGNEPS